MADTFILGTTVSGKPRKRAKAGSSLQFLRSLIGHQGDDCVLWPFATQFRGYGGILYQGKQYGAHRLMCIFEHGEPPEGDWEAAHSCNTPLCCNPRHLRWATPTDNHADKIAAGTTARGIKSPTARLSESAARTIKYERTDEPLGKVAGEFGVDKCTVLDIRKMRTWAWL